MAVGNRLYFCRNKSFSKSRFLYANNAALFAVASVSRLSERRYRNRARNNAVDSAKISRPAAWGIILLLLAVFPANIYMAMNTELFKDFNPTMIYLRLPIQFILIAWAYWFTREN